MQEREFIQAALNEVRANIAETSEYKRNAAPVFWGELAVKLEELALEEARLQGRLHQIDDQQREAKAAVEELRRSEASRSEREEIAFWFRRFFTTLGIANGAAFAALASGVLGADEPDKIAPLVGPAMDFFIWGALSAGSIPFWIWLRLTVQGWLSNNPDEPKLRGVWRGLEAAVRQVIFLATVVSVTMFCSGLFEAVGAVNGMATAQREAVAAREVAVVQ